MLGTHISLRGSWSQVKGLTPDSDITVSGMDIREGDLVAISVYATSSSSSYSEVTLPSWVSSEKDERTQSGNGHVFVFAYGLAPAAVSSLTFDFTHPEGEAVTIVVNVTAVDGAALGYVSFGGVQSTLDVGYPPFDEPVPYAIIGASRWSQIDNFSVFRNLAGYVELDTPAATNFEIGYVAGYAAGASGTISGSATLSSAYCVSAYLAVYDVALNNRVRSNVSLTVGDILQEVASPQFELTAREAFFPDVVLVEGALYPFTETLAPEVVTHRWFPLPVATDTGLREYAASTKLGRMTRAYPEPFVARAVDLVGTDTMTAQQVLEQLFARWATEFDWFTYKTVPDLRHRVASADAPSDYTDGVGELTLPAIVMRQEEPNRRTMRQILDRVLSLFPGTALVQDADGDIALRPTYGPDAPTTPDVTLSTDDIASISDGVPDTQRIYNQARVTSDGGDFEEDTALTTSLYGLIAYGDEPEAALGPDGEDVLPTAREEVDVNAWHAFDTLAAGDTIDVEYTIRMYALYYGSDPSMTNPPSDVTLETTETATITLTLGAGETVVRVSDLVGEFLGGGGIDAYADIAFEADRASGVYVGYKDFIPYGAVRHFSGTSWFRFAWVVEVDTTGLGYVEAPETVIGKFGYDLTTDEILSTDGSSNALAVSQATYGERELQLSSDLFPLTLDQALRIAEGAVLHYINPRTIYQVEQAWWNAYPVKPDHIGRIVEIPTTEEGFVQARSYSDSFEDPEAPQVASTFELVLTEAAFTTDGLLAFDDGELWSFDDGSLRKADE